MYCFPVLSFRASIPFLFAGLLIVALSPAVIRAAPQGNELQDEVAGKSHEAIDLFDGKSLDGWSGDPVYWSVKDGAIVGQTTEETALEHNTFLIWNGEVADFELELEFRITNNNSGLQFRSVDRGDHRVQGYQADFDAANDYTGIIYEEGGRGILVPRARHVVIAADGTRTESDEATCDEKQLLQSIRPGDWNRSRITARGSQITHMINGFVTAQLDDGETGKSRDRGILALQLHQGEPMTIEFRNLRLKKFE